MVVDSRLYSEEGLGLDLVFLDAGDNVDTETDHVRVLLSHSGLNGKYRQVCIPLSCEREFITTNGPLPRLRVAEENAFGLKPGFYYGLREIEGYLFESREVLGGVVDGD